ncbi:hypothetical protein [Sporisorium scitamineum]|uniref:Uncharacterized protein n=1 Tax=Sporisorium scitamineum TaxID=49012 RepID=A0A0F7RTD1_9BASI|nr:hypothetical protein [Sporisorium scitamineum]
MKDMLVVLRGKRSRYYTARSEGNIYKLSFLTVL